jgi:hypothetical protein
MFHEAQRRLDNGKFYGQHRQDGYVADLLRNYGDGGRKIKLPTVDEQGVKRALNYRRSEHEHYTQLEAQLKQLKNELDVTKTDLGNYKSIAEEFADFINTLPGDHLSNDSPDTDGERVSNSDGRRGDNGTDVLHETKPKRKEKAYRPSTAATPAVVPIRGPSATVVGDDASGRIEEVPLRSGEPRESEVTDEGGGS